MTLLSTGSRMSAVSAHIPTASEHMLETRIDIELGQINLISPIIEEEIDIYEVLTQSLAWRKDSIRIRGKLVDIPRLQAWYGEPHCVYTYSGLTMAPEPFPPILKHLRDIAQDKAGAPFNCVLCNWYRDGQDSVGWHSDNEPELGNNPVIASYSFGATRRFLIKPKKGNHRASAIELPHNSLLIMGGAMQHHWNHQVPKTDKPVSGRINLTFRYIRNF